MLNFTEAEINDKLLNMASLLDLNTGFKGFWWKKYGFSVNSTSYTNDSLETRVTQSATDNNNSSNTHTIYYTDDFEIVGATFKPKGTIQSISGTFSYIGSNISILKNKYAWLTSSGKPQSTLVKMTDSTTYVYNEYDSTIKKYVGCANYAIKYSFTQNLYDYVCSSDINAYPNGDFAEDGYYYELIGQLLKDGAKVASGSYVGTNKYGNVELAGYTNQLIIGFRPKFVFVFSPQWSTYYLGVFSVDRLKANYTTYGWGIIGNSGFANYSSSAKARFIESTTMLEWGLESGSVYEQLNSSSYTYYWVAIG